MSNLKTLLKYNFLQSFNKLVKNLKGKKKKSTLTLGITLGVLGLLIYAFLLLYIFLFSSLFAETSKKDGAIMIVVVVMSLFTFTSTLTKANSVLFRMKDYDLLAALPIKSKDILISKFIELIGFNPLISLFVGLGAIVMYSIFNPVSIWFWIFSPIIFLLLPIVPIVIGCLVSYVLGFIPIKQKVRNILSTLLYTGFLLVVMIFSFSISSTSEADMLVKMEEMYNSLKNIYFLAPAIVSGILGNVTSVLFYSIISLISLVLFIMLVSANFSRIINKSNINGTNTKYKYDDKQYNKSSSFKALFKKEMVYYFNTPNYIMNTIVGPIMSVIFTVILANKISESISLGSSDVGINMSIEFFSLLLLPAYLFTFGLTTTTAPSLSLEGKGFWIIKSSPISYKDVFMSKIALNLLVTIPFLVADVVLLFILSEISIINILLLFLIIITFIVFNSVLGLYLSIKKHDFNIEPIKAIKQSMSVLINMLITFVLLILETFICIFIYILFGSIISLILILVFNLIILGLVLLLLLTDGTKSFNSIDV